MSLNKVILTVLLSTLITTGCGSKKSLSPGDGPGAQSWPAYSKASVAGNVFGKPWQASVGVIRPATGSTDEVSLNLYSQVTGDVCKDSFATSKPIATLILPANLSTIEYVADMNQPGTGNPIVFIDVASAANVLAERTKVRINRIADGVVNMSVYAYGRDTDGSVNEINGEIDVIDCAKKVDFSLWEGLHGWYKLVSIDGVASPGDHTAIIELSERDFYDRASSKWVRTVMVPLYYFASGNTAGNYEFGIMQDLGISTYKEAGDKKTYGYKFNGPINTSNTDITLDLQIEVVETSTQLQVNYTLEIPGHVKRTSHAFVLAK